MRQICIHARAGHHHRDGTDRAGLSTESVPNTLVSIYDGRLATQHQGGQEEPELVDLPRVEERAGQMGAALEQDRGHPVGATGIAQIVELTIQLRGAAGKRQREGARVALAECSGGEIGSDSALAAVTILST